jgi:uncharacterized protein (AIM24 family)
MEYRVKVDEMKGTGVTFEVHQFRRETHAPVGMGMTSQGPQMAAAQGGAAIQVYHAAAVPVASRQLRMVLEGSSVLLEPGALQYAVGKLAVDVTKNDKGGNMFTRAVTAAATGESGFSTRFTGAGEVWTEPTQKYLILAEMDGESGMLLDDRAFYACEGSISLSTHMHRSVQGVLSGAGLMQPKLEGRGVFVAESPVPAGEIEQIDLDGSGELIVDGDLMLMYSSMLQVELRPLTRGLRNLARSGEGLVYVLKGHGSVWLTPSAKLGW